MTEFDLRLLLIVAPAGAGMLGQRRVRSVFARYAKVPNSTGLSGEETATERLARHSMSGVAVERVAFLKTSPTVGRSHHWVSPLTRSPTPSKTPSRAGSTGFAAGLASASAG